MNTTHVGLKVQIDNLIAEIAQLMLVEASARQVWDHDRALRARSRRQALQARLASVRAAA